MNKKIRFASAALGLVMAASAAALPAAAAAGETQKDENVFVTLAPDGTAEKQTVSVWLHSDAGLAGFEDLSRLDDIHSLKGPETFRQEGERLVWDAAGTDLYYQGTTGRQLPVTAEIAYELDGEPLTAEELLGRSGHLKVTIRLTNHETRTILADGRTRTICTPFAALVGTNLDADHFANITAEHGTVQTDSANQLVGWACLPGMRQSLDGLLVGKLAELEDKFFDEVSLEADVTDCPAISFMIACASDPDALSDLDEADDLGELPDDIDKLRDATDELLSGTAELLDGVIELHDAVKGDLADGVVKLDDSVNGELTDGVKQLRDGLDTLASNNDTLNDGADQIVAAVFASASQQLSASLGQTVTLTPANYRAVLTTLSGQLSASAVELAKDQISAGLGNIPDAQKNAVVYLAANFFYNGNVNEALTQAAQALTATMPHSAQAALEAPAALEEAPAPTVTPAPEATPAPEEPSAPETTPAPEEPSAPETTPAPEEPSAPETTPAPEEPSAPETTPAPEEPSAPAQPNTPEPSAAPEPAAPAAEGLGVRRASAAPAVSLLGSRGTNRELQPLAAGPDPAVIGEILNGGYAKEVAAAWNKLAAAAQLQAVIAQLDGVVQFRDGLAAYTEGVASAADGGQKLYNAVTGELADGTRELRDAVTGELGDGVNELLDGVKELVDGVAEYDEEGISKITGREELNQLTALLDTADALRDASGEYRSYSGAPEGVSGTVKFVMRTREPEPPEPQESETAAQPAAEPEHISFWQRLKNLFMKPQE